MSLTSHILLQPTDLNITFYKKQRLYQFDLIQPVFLYQDSLVFLYSDGEHPYSSEKTRVKVLRVSNPHSLAMSVTDSPVSVRSLTTSESLSEFMYFLKLHFRILVKIRVTVCSAMSSVVAIL